MGRSGRGTLPALLALLTLGACAPAPLPSSTAVEPGTVTYTKQVARIFQQHCQECHRPGGGPGFALTDYAQAYRRRVKILEMVESRQMPPWRPVEGHGDFTGVRRLAPGEIELVRRWLDAGAPEGDPADSPKPRVFTEGWTLGSPGLVLTTDEFTVPPRSRDIYRCFVMPLRVGSGQFLAASEILPGNRKIVHHVVTFLDLTGRSLALDEADPGPGYRCFGAPGFQSVGGIGGWAPGLAPLQIARGVAFGLPSAAQVVVQVHYHNPGAAAETDQTRIGLHFASPPFDRRIQYIPVRTLGIHIPARATAHPVTAMYTVEASRAMEITHIQAHMHLLGRGFRASVRYPDGSERPLLRIDDWDFEHQERYEFRRPVPLPAYSNIHVTCIYDNSSGNRHNPSFPPRLVTFGFETTDEMCEAHILGTSPLSVR